MLRTEITISVDSFSLRAMSDPLPSYFLVNPLLPRAFQADQLNSFAAAGCIRCDTLVQSRVKHAAKSMVEVKRRRKRKMHPSQGRHSISSLDRRKC